MKSIIAVKSDNIKGIKIMPSQRALKFPVTSFEASPQVQDGYVWLVSVKYLPEFVNLYKTHEDQDYVFQIVLTILSSIQTHGAAKIALSPMVILRLASLDPNRKEAAVKASYSHYKMAIELMLDKGFIKKDGPWQYTVEPELLQNAGERA